MPGDWEAGPGWRAGGEGERESLARIGYARTLTRDRSTEAHTPGRCGCRTASCQPTVNVLDGGSGSPGPRPFRAGPSGAVRAPGARARLAGSLIARGRLGAGAGCRAPQGVGALAPGLRLGQQGRGHPAARLPSRGPQAASHAPCSARTVSRSRHRSSGVTRTVSVDVKYGGDLPS
jgi:hypothetical protein